MTRLQKLAVGAAALVGLLSNLSAGAHAQTIIEEWSSAKFPAPPALKRDRAQLVGLSAARSHLGLLRIGQAFRGEPRDRQEGGEATGEFKNR